MLGEPAPHDADPIGQFYAFEKRVAKAGGGDGFADVWKRDFFAWEYKGKYKDLKAAYVQLLSYKDGLGNPPLLIVSDLDRIEIRTNFEKLSPVLTTITLDDLAADDPSKPLSRSATPSPRRRTSAPRSSRPRSRRRLPATSLSWPRHSGPEGTIRTTSRTSWTGSYSASLPRTPTFCRRASSRGCPRLRRVDRTSSLMH
jgi:hypothetical protein